MTACKDENFGHEMFALARALWPICRSITGDGVRLTLNKIKEHLPSISIHEIPTGTKCFDWTVPNEWNVHEAYIEDPLGNRIVDFANNNLHLVGYSVSVNAEFDLSELQPRLHSLPDIPNAIPYVTSYYEQNWGFCIADEDRQRLPPGSYKVKINTSLEPGFLTYADLILHGETDTEILISTYVCHPSMANNELSGPLVATWLAKWISSKKTKYTYRFVFIPETIGSIVYLSSNLMKMRQNTIAGFVLSCVGDERAWSFVPSRYGNTLADKAAKHILSTSVGSFDTYSFLERGSDERQYCSPGIDLPVVSILRSKYATYPEYHTSLDDLTFVTPKGLADSLAIHKKCIDALELNVKPKTKILCEPMMSKRNLRPTISKVGGASDSMNMMNVLAYSDGENDLFDIASLVKLDVFEVAQVVNNLREAGVIEVDRI